MGFFSSFKKFFTGGDAEPAEAKKPVGQLSPEDAEGQGAAAAETASAAEPGAPSEAAAAPGPEPEAPSVSPADGPEAGSETADAAVVTLTEIVAEAEPEAAAAASEAEAEPAAEPAPVPGPETEAASEAAAEIEAESEPAPEPAPVPEPESEAAPEAEAEAESEPAPEPAPAPEPESEAVPEAAAEPEPEASEDAGNEPAPEPETEIAPEEEAESAPAAPAAGGAAQGGFFASLKRWFGGAETQTPKAGAEVGAAPESPAEMEDASAPEAEAEAAVGPETASGAAPEAEPEPAPEVKAEAGPGAEAEVEPAAVPETEAEAAPEAPMEVEDASAPEAEAEAAVGPETASGAAPEAEPVPAPEAEAEAESGAAAETEPAAAPESPAQAAPQGGVLATLKRWFGGGGQQTAAPARSEPPAGAPAARPEQAAAAAAPAAGEAGSADFYQELTVRLREADRRLSVWLDIVLEGVTEAGPELNSRITFLLRSLSCPQDEVAAFVGDFDRWLTEMEYRWLDEFRSELQYRLSLALEMEDEEDERNRLFLKLSDSLSKTRAQISRHFDGLLSSHGELDDDFWEELEELFISADLGIDASLELVRRLRERAREAKVTTTDGVRELLREEVRGIFVRPRHIVGVNPPEVVLMIGVNGAGKTTTIAKLAYRDKMQGKKVMIAAADTFRAAAIDQMRIWAERVGTLFHAKQPGSDPASVAYEAIDRALAEGVDVLYIDTAGRLQTKVDLMDELGKVRKVIARRHPGAPHRTVLVLDATTGQNALSQARLFKESAGVDELILTKLDGTAKGGVAIAVALQHQLPISYVGLGEKVEDLRPFSGDDYADALFSGRDAA